MQPTFRVVVDYRIERRVGTFEEADAHSVYAKLTFFGTQSFGGKTSPGRTEGGMHQTTQLGKQARGLPT